MSLNAQHMKNGSLWTFDHCTDTSLISYSDMIKTAK